MTSSTLKYALKHKKTGKYYGLRRGCRSDYTATIKYAILYDTFAGADNDKMYMDEVVPIRIEEVEL